MQARSVTRLAMAALPVAILAGIVWRLDADSPPAQAHKLDYKPPRHYVCCRAQGPIVIDGKLDDAGWKGIPWTEDFVDIEGDPRPLPRFRTRAKIAWDDDYLYVAAELEEPHVWATLTKHDSVIFNDPDFEVFLNPSGDNHVYGELETNALNTTWDLLLVRPYRDGGPAVDDWDIHGLKTAVHVDGTINNPSDTDHGWSIEIAWPWKSIRQMTKRPMPPEWLSPNSELALERSKNGKEKAVPPQPWEQWRINFSRVEWDIQIVDGKYQRVPDRKEHNWVWSPQGVIDMHQPEHWAYLQFSANAPGVDKPVPDPTGPARALLHRVYYAQRQFRLEHNSFAPTLEALGVAGLTHESLAGPLKMETTSNWFEVSVPVKNGPTVRIRADSLVTVE
jgi:hypothetical protein